MRVRDQTDNVFLSIEGSGWDEVFDHMQVEESLRNEANRRFEDALYRRAEIIREISNKEYIVSKVKDDSKFLL